MTEPREVVTDKGVVSFDGRVFELFGFMAQDVRRWHVAEIVSLEIREARIVGTVLQVEVKNGAGYSSSIEPSDSERKEIEDLLAAVRAASPNIAR